MEGFQTTTPFSRFVVNALNNEKFTLIDIGCSSGIDAVWRVFGHALRAFAFDPNVDEVARLSERESLAGVSYIAAFVGVPADDSGAVHMRSGNFWARMPWDRLSVSRTLQIQAAATATMDTEEKTKLNLWNQVPLADPHKPIVIPSFVCERGIDDVDFVKIDVDGADFLILRSLVPMFEDTKVLGVGIEVNFHGSDDPNIHTLHNVDRLMKQNGFELFALSQRPYSMAALPAPYQLTIPAQTAWGRILQGDALYLRDAAAPEQARWAASAGPLKLAKLAALFSLAGLPDCAAEVLIRYRPMLEQRIDVQAGLDALTAQCIPEGEPAPTYANYMAEFEADGDRFWPALRVAPPPRAPDPEPVADVLAGDSDEIAALQAELASLKASKSWRLTAPLRDAAASLRRLLWCR
jgi:FkbM family methyltransferase